MVLWNDRLSTYVDAKMFGDDMIPITSDGKYSLHNDTCPVKIQERIRNKCVWCQLEDGEGILTLRSKMGFMYCDKHADTNIDVQYHGRTCKRDDKTLRLMYIDALRQKRRAERKAKKASSNTKFEGFLT